MARYTKISGAPTEAPQPPATGFRAFLSRISEVCQSAIAQQRPWGEAFDRRAFSKPENFADASSRIRVNVSYFRSNYFTFLAGLIVLSVLWHPGSWFLIAVLLVAWAFLFVYRTESLVLFNRTFSDKEIAAFLSVVTVVLIFLFTSIIFWLISVVLFGVLVICTHGAFRVPDDLYLDEQQSSGGALSFLGGSRG